MTQGLLGQHGGPIFGRRDPDARGYYGPYGGRFVVRGGALDVMEGEWPAARTVIIGFPSVEQAKAWYESAAYQALLPIRQRHARTDFLVVVEGVS